MFFGFECVRFEIKLFRKILFRLHCKILFVNLPKNTNICGLIFILRLLYFFAPHATIKCQISGVFFAFLFRKKNAAHKSTKANYAHIQLEDPNRHITRVGKVLRKFSPDELPQLTDIIKQDMSIIDPLPALRNQFNLIEERDKYEADDIKPGGRTGKAKLSTSGENGNQIEWPKYIGFRWH